jgi:hypothetical protein
MERFYNNNNDDEQDDESFFGSEDDFDEELAGEVVGYIDQQGILDVMQMDLAQTELNQHLLSKAIEIAKGGWFWAFKSTERRLAEVEAVYRRLSIMTGEGDPSGAINTNEFDDREGN